MPNDPSGLLASRNTIDRQRISRSIEPCRAWNARRRVRNQRRLQWAGSDVRL